MMDTLVQRMAEICGPEGVVSDPLELRTYECDGLTSHRCSPGLVVLPQTAGQVAEIVTECETAGVPFVARGSGTGLSGGALPRTDGVLTWLGDGTGGSAGYDLTGAFIGSEGTLGVVTKIIVKLTKIPEAVTTLLAASETTGHGGAAVSAIIGSGILPGAIEMMDALAIEAAEAAVACRYPAGAGAVLIVELDGPEADVEREAAAVRALCEQAGAT